ncbi:WD40 repeat domain-containing protein [Fimbriiglobus ruber]|uniref:High-affnity carbon uptake protein Hat/HatR n=1 Tax=Fimbriiglobus ruber TaxID=1908690 RepID=A0A225DNP3_9BACT|nr:WD40 repeat domain-containing protein [Fimbriiglobus ruber]OWK37965.1 High-affnity carbon uptake protein Hat/HatR [Fimbriiglobus ruber]
MPTVHPDRRDFLLTGAAALAAGNADLTAAPVRPRVPAPVVPDPPLPVGVIARFGSSRFRCPEDPTDLKLSPRGQFVLAFTETTLYIFETATGRLTGELARPPAFPLSPRRSVAVCGRELLPPPLPRLSLAFPDEDSAAFPMISSDRATLDVIRIDLRSGTATRTPTRVPLPQRRCAVLSPDGTAVAVVLGDRIRFHTLSDGSLLWSVVGSIIDDPIPCFSPDGRRLAVVMTDAIVVFDALSGSVLFRCPVAAENITEKALLVFTPDGLQLRYGFDSDEPFIWNLTTGEQRSFGRPLFVGTTEFVRWADSGERRGLEAVRLDDETAVRKFESVFSFETDRQIGRDYLRKSVANSHVAVAIRGGAVVVWDTRTGKVLPQSIELPCSLMSPCFGPTGRVLARSWPEETIWCSWDLATGKPRRYGPWDGVGLSPDERYEVRTAWMGMGADQAFGVELTDTASRDRVCGLRISDSITSLRSSEPLFSGDGKLLAQACGAYLCVRQLPGGKQQNLTPAGDDNFLFDHLIETSYTGRMAIVGLPYYFGRGVNICIFDTVASKVCLRIKLDRHHNGDYKVSISPDGTHFALLETTEPIDFSGAFSMNLKVSNARTGDPVTLLVYSSDLHYERWFPPRFSPDNRAIAVAESRREIAIWEVASGAVRKRFRTRGIVTGAEFSPDGTALAICSYDAPLDLWDYRGLRTARRTPDRASVRRAWDDLTADAARAFAAIQTLARAPDVALPLLGERLPPVARAIAAQVRQLVADLDANDYPTRTRADAALRGLADHAAALIREEYEVATAPEVRSRLAAILTTSSRRTPSQLRVIRAVEAIEWIGTPDAARLLRAWADGAPGALLTTEAQAALRRVKAAVKMAAN